MKNSIRILFAVIFLFQMTYPAFSEQTKPATFVAFKSEDPGMAKAEQRAKDKTETPKTEKSEPEAGKHEL
jgi:hypothetical protein